MQYKFMPERNAADSMSSDQQDSGETTCLEFLQNIFCTNDGTLYGIAAMTDRNFVEYQNKAVSSTSEDKARHESENLIGCYEIQLKYSNSLMNPIDRSVRILIFSFKTKEESDAFLTSRFTVCGNNMCYWSKHASKWIKIIRLAPIIKYTQNKRFYGDIQDLFAQTDSTIKNQITSRLFRRRKKLITQRRETDEEKKICRNILDNKDCDFNQKTVFWHRHDEDITIVQIQTNVLIRDWDEQDPDFSLMLSPFDNSRKQLSLSDSSKASKDALLQVSATNKVFIFDLSYKEPVEMFFINNTPMFSDPNKYVDLGLQ